MDVGEGDEVGFGRSGGVVGGREGQQGVANLSDVDCATEGSFLAVVALEL